jgi:hypothetical protein
VAVVKEKLAKLVPMKSVDKELEEVEEVAGIGGMPTFRILLVAAVISLVVVGVTTLFFVLFLPVEEDATVELPTEEKPLEEMPIDTPTV